MSVNPAARDAAARAFYIAGCDDREWGERAWVDMGGSEPSYERAEIEIAADAALAAALPHLTAEDVPHVAAQALRDAAADWSGGPTGAAPIPGWWLCERANRIEEPQR